MDFKLKELIPVLDRLYRLDKLNILYCQGSYGALHPTTGIMLTGSVAEGCALPRLLATGIFEHDVMISVPLNCDDVVEDVPGNLVYVYLKSEGPDGNQTFISPYKERTQLQSDIMLYPDIFKCIMDGVWDTLLPEACSFRDFQTEAMSTNASLECDFIWKLGFDVGRFNMDYVPSKIVPTWPKVAKDWINRSRKWPSHAEVLRIADMGCHIVPKTSPTGDIHREWRYSFSQSEIEFTKLQTTTQRKLYLFLKYIFYVFIKSDNQCGGVNENTRDAGQSVDAAMSVTKDSDSENNTILMKTLHSYSVKTAWMWFCEQHPPHDDIWNNENISTLLRTFLESYNAFLANAFIPSYFIPEQNIINGVPCEILNNSRDMIEFILSNLTQVVMQILDAFVCLTDEYINERTDEVNSSLQTMFALLIPPIGDPDVDD